jgi:hypothetical protein
MHTDKINAGIVHCLDYAIAAPIPEKAASEFLSRLLAEPSWTADEVEEVTVFVASVIQALRRRSDSSSDHQSGGREQRGGE